MQVAELDYIASSRAAGIAKAHREDGKNPFIVKILAGHTHPFAEPVSGCIGEWHARLMHLRAGSLAGNQNRRAGGRLQHRPRSQRQRGSTGVAGAYARKQALADVESDEAGRAGDKNIHAAPNG